MVALQRECGRIIGGQMSCTVIIITYNRPEHLRRLLGYYNEYGGELNIVIADSSADDIRRINSGVVESFHNPLFKYLNKFNSSINPISKIHYSLKQVFTEYCVVCADDDFISAAGIIESAEFLKYHLEFAAVCGNYAIFKVNNKGMPYYKLYKGESNTCATAQSRLYSVATNNNGNFYAVRRTSFMRLLFEEARKITDDLVISGTLKVNSSAFFVEYVVTWISVIYGKTKCLDSLFCVREGETPSKFKRIGVSLPEIMKESNYRDKETEFLDCIVNHLSIQCGMEARESTRTVKDCIEMTKEHHLSTMVKISAIMLDLRIPIWLDEYIRKTYRDIASMISNRSYHPYNNMTMYLNELSGINQYLESNAKEIYR